MMFRFAPWSLLVALWVVSPAAAQQRRGGDAPADQNGGQQGGLQQGLGIDLGLSADDAFGGGVERGGPVGAATTIPGAAATAPAAGAGVGGARAGVGGRLGGGFGGFGGFGGMGGLGGFGAQQRDMGAATSEPPAIRTRLRSAVDVAPRRPEQVERRAATTLNRVSAEKNRFGGVRVEVQGETAVLRGQVESQQERRMSALMMMLEPGVSDVESHVRVQP